MGTRGGCPERQRGAGSVSTGAPGDGGQSSVRPESVSESVAEGEVGEGGEERLDPGAEMVTGQVKLCTVARVSPEGLAADAKAWCRGKSERVPVPGTPVQSLSFVSGRRAMPSQREGPRGEAAVG